MACSPVVFLTISNLTGEKIFDAVRRVHFLVLGQLMLLCCVSAVAFSNQDLNKDTRVFMLVSVGLGLLLLLVVFRQAASLFAEELVRYNNDGDDNKIVPLPLLQHTSAIFYQNYITFCSLKANGCCQQQS